MRKLFMPNWDANSISMIEIIRSSTCIDDRYDHLSHVLSQVSITGLYLEFGVFDGGSVNYIADAIYPRIIFGFDSFVGLPEEWKRRRDNALTLPAGTFSVASLPEVRSNVRLIKGWFEDTLPAFIMNRCEDVAFVNIDSDIYSSARTVLRNLNNRIVQGTILYFDEITGWGDLVEQYDTWEEGEYRALLEWLSEYDREVEAISRNNRYGAALRVMR